MQSDEPAAVLALLDAFARAMSERDVEGAVACFTPGPQAVLIGSGLDERRIGEAEIREHFQRDFGQSEWLTMRWAHRGVVPAGNVFAAWGQGEIEAGVGGDRVETRFRFTAVADHIDGCWRFAQGHLSFPAPGQRPGESWPASIEQIVQEIAADRLEHLAEDSPDRTITLLFTDIEDSSRALERLGDAAWLQVVRVHHDVVSPCVSEYGGQVVKSLGDGFMIAFRSAHRGVECALAMQRALATIDERAGVRVRMGLHTGEVLREGADLFGRHVTMAARVAGHAVGGQVLVSGDLRNLVQHVPGCRFVNGRDVELKGLTGTHRLYEVVPASD